MPKLNPVMVVVMVVIGFTVGVGGMALCIRWGVSPLYPIIWASAVLIILIIILRHVQQRNR